jgi:quercetin dioxygenase-like cupin family protein
MQILRKDMLEVAVVDPSKKIGEDGQYTRYKGDHPQLKKILEGAHVRGLEVRKYVEHIAAHTEGIIPLKYVITEIPPMHVQPFHSHTNVDEINLITSGEVYFIESESLAETDVEQLRKQGTLLSAGDVVVSAPGKRHTLANLSDAYAQVTGTISAIAAITEFQPDWKR